MTLMDDVSEVPDEDVQCVIDLADGDAREAVRQLLAERQALYDYAVQLRLSVSSGYIREDQRRARRQPAASAS